MEHSIDPGPRARQTDYRRIAEGLRNNILNGKLSAGARFPSTKELAVEWKCSAFTIHKAMVALVKEGWIDRLHGEGTFVAGFENRFVCAGIYHGANLCSDEQSAFLRRIHVSLLEQFRRLKKETLVFMDTRPEREQGKILPALAEAILQRRIQCLVLPTPYAISWPAFSKLTLPISTLSYAFRSSVNFDHYSLLRDGVRRLAQEGCRSIGLVSSVYLEIEKFKGDPVEQFYLLFHRAIREEGLFTRDEWIRKPKHYRRSFNPENHGYTEFKNLWKLREIPDGLIVFPDNVARGVIMGVLEAGPARVAQKMKFVFHRNAHTNFLCPFPVTWAISDEDILATELIQQIQKQFAGEKISPVHLPYILKDS